MKANIYCGGSFLRLMDFVVSKTTRPAGVPQAGAACGVVWLGAETERASDQSRVWTQDETGPFSRRGLCDRHVALLGVWEAAAPWSGGSACHCRTRGRASLLPRGWDLRDWSPRLGGRMAAAPSAATWSTAAGRWRPALPTWRGVLRDEKGEKDASTGGNCTACSPLGLCIRGLLFPLT